jgi:predicted transcriptional regulator
MLQDLLDQEAKARMADTATARKHFEHSSKGIESLQRQLHSSETTLSERISEESKLLSQIIEEQREDLLTQIKQAAEQLRQDKADRKMLASLLDNLSHQLAGDKA